MRYDTHRCKKQHTTKRGSATSVKAQRSCDCTIIALPRIKNNSGALGREVDENRREVRTRCVLLPESRRICDCLFVFFLRVKCLTNGRKDFKVISFGNRSSKTATLQFFDVGGNCVKNQDARGRGTFVLSVPFVTSGFHTRHSFCCRPKCTLVMCRIFIFFALLYYF